MCTDLEQSNVNIGEFDWSRATIRSGQPMHERVMGRDTVVFDASTRLRLRKTRMTREESGVLSWQNLGDQSSYDDYLQICQNERERRAECESAAYKAEADQRSKSWGEWLLGTTKHTKNAKQGHVLTGDADGAVNLGEFGKVTAKSRRLKGRVWLARGLPVHAHHLLPNYSPPELDSAKRRSKVPRCWGAAPRAQPDPGHPPRPPAAGNTPLDRLKLSFWLLSSVVLGGAPWGHVEDEEQHSGISNSR